MNHGAGSQRRFKRQLLSKHGDVVIVTASRTHYQAIRLENGEILNNKYGHFSHDDMIGQPFGAWIKSRSINNTRSRQRMHRNQIKQEQKSNDNNDTSSNTKQLPRKRKHSELSPQKAKSAKFGEICLLRPNCELWTLALSHRTQILYDADKSLITYLLQIKPNDIVFESGTGSGSLSTSFSRIVSPFGHLFTFEFNPLRTDYARNDFKNLLIDNLITVIHRNIVQNGFPKRKELMDIMTDIVTQHKDPNEDLDIDLDTSNHNNNATEKKRKVSEYKDSFGRNTTKIDTRAWLSDEKLHNIKHWISKLSALDQEEFVNGVFLDLPKPWDAIQSAYHVLKYHGKICSFSPCIEQVQKTCQVLGRTGFVDIRTFEVLSRDHIIRNHAFEPLDLNTNNSIHTIRSRPNTQSATDMSQSTTKMVVSRPVAKAFGHTGYLTFALKSLSK